MYSLGHFDKWLQIIAMNLFDVNSQSMEDFITSCGRPVFVVIDAPGRYKYSKPFEAGVPSPADGDSDEGLFRNLINLAQIPIDSEALCSHDLI